MRSPNISYLPAVDHLRGVAALWIVAYHGQQLVGSMLAHGRLFVAADWIRSTNPLAALLYEGHTAVALFMTLSGFIFTYGAYGHAIDYRAFVTNRLLRIYPLFMVVLLAGFAIYPARFDAGRFVSTVLLMANVSNVDIGPLSGMFWAVSVEFQFYLLFPALLACSAHARGATHCKSWRWPWHCGCWACCSGEARGTCRISTCSAALTSS